MASSVLAKALALECRDAQRMCGHTVWEARDAVEVAVRALAAEAALVVLVSVVVEACAFPLGGVQPPTRNAFATRRVRRPVSHANGRQELLRLTWPQLLSANLVPPT